MKNIDCHIPTRFGRQADRASTPRTRAVFVRLLALLLLVFIGTATTFADTVEDLQRRIQEVYKNSSDSVVNITTTTLVANWFNRSIPQEGSGSGFIWDENGHIVTNYHVIQDAQSIIVSCGDDEVYPAELIGADPATDIAVLKIDVKRNRLTPLELADSSELIVGQFVAAIGNPFGYNRTLTFGIISALGRVVRSANDHYVSEAIQTDTPINPGNSGGPLLDLDGNVVGINSSIISPNGVSAGIGFAISSNTVKDVVPVLIEEGKYPHPWLGISTIDLNASVKNMLVRAGMEIPVTSGIFVLEAVAGGPAARAGIRGSTRSVQLSRRMRIPVGGDIIVAVDGHEIHSLKDLSLLLEKQISIGERISITYYRDRREYTITAIAGELPEV